MVEEKDATDQQRPHYRGQHELLCVRLPRPARGIDHIRSDNAAGEYYITDVPAVLSAQGKRIEAVLQLEPCERLAVNNVEELAAVESALR